jgi:DNA-binding PadR family transcriptional regulator
VLISYLPVIILNQLLDTVISPSTIISYVEQSFGVKLSSGTVYPILEKLERDGHIVRLQKRTKRIYVLTEKGKLSMKYLECTTTPVHSSLNISLENC